MLLYKKILDKLGLVGFSAMVASFAALAILQCFSGYMELRTHDVISACFAIGFLGGCLLFGFSLLLYHILKT